MTIPPRQAERNHLAICWLLVLFAYSAAAQPLHLPAAAGGSLMSPTLRVDYSVGEPVTTTLLAGQQAVTQGFLQPSVFDCGALSSAMDVDRAICKGDTLWFDGTPLTKAGKYEASFSNQFGCDSTVRLNLTVHDGGALAVRDDQADMAKGGDGLPIQPLANDGLPGILTPALALVGIPAAGFATLLDSATLLYLPPGNTFTGLDSFAYSVCLQECPATCDTGWIYVSVRVELNAEIEKQMPNAFTPNGDGSNDTFDPLDYLREKEVYYTDRQAEIIVFNRWNEILVQKRPYEPWTGLGMGGHALPQGAYYYRLRLYGAAGVQELRGAVHLLK